VRAVILAGGRGTRLRPFTAIFPKPLIPVGDMPILEILLRQLRRHGVTDVTILTGHLAYLLEGYFGDGAKLGMSVDYVRETEPLGTAGPLSQLVGRLDDDFFVMNGDLLADLDFSALMKRHLETGCEVTVGTFSHTVMTELGVLQISEQDRVVDYEEKPTLHYDVSMGIYAMSPPVLARIPEGYYDMPTLILDLLSAGEPVASWRHDGQWLDIGRSEDYDVANELFQQFRDTILPDYPSARD
jgi:NDP-sugar pyrophosphorylase family protein